MKMCQGELFNLRFQLGTYSKNGVFRGTLKALIAGALEKQCFLCDIKVLNCYEFHF